MDLIPRGLANGVIEIDYARLDIRYVHQGTRRDYSHPQEFVQAETFLRLIMDYGYPPPRIAHGVPIITDNDTTNRDAADMIVYGDDEHRHALIVIACRAEDAPRQAFNHAVEQACRQAAALKAGHACATSGREQACFEIPAGQPQDSIAISDIPRCADHENPPAKTDQLPEASNQVIETQTNAPRKIDNDNSPPPDPVLGETNQVILVDTRKANLQAILAMTRQSRRHIDILSRNLDPLIYNATAFLEAIRAFVLQNRHTRLRALLYQPREIVRKGHRFIDMAGKLSSFIQLRAQHEDFKQFDECLFIADGTGYIHKLHSARYEATINFADKSVSKYLTQQFNEMWNKARPDSNMSKFHL